MSDLPRRPAPPRRTVLLGVLALLLTGCRADDPPGAGSAPGTDQPETLMPDLQLDLRTPLDRARAGIADGRDSRIRQRQGDQIDVRLQLPAGKELRTPAFEVQVVGGRGGASQPDVVRVLRTATDQADAATVLQEATVLLGLDAALVADFVASLEVERETGGNRVLRGEPLDYLTVEVMARRGAAPGEVTVSYAFSWDPLTP